MSEEIKKGAPVAGAKSKQAQATAEASVAVAEAPTAVAKRIVLVGGDKGGVGKSTTARTLVEWYESRQIRFLAFDGDNVNPTLQRFHADAQRMHTKSSKGFEPLVNNFEAEHIDVQVVDLGAGTSLVFGEFTDRTDFFALANKHGVRITLVFLLAPSAESINLLKFLSERCSSAGDYVTLKNESSTGTGDLWDNSKARKNLIENLGAVELSLPMLDADAFSKADAKSFRWQVASASKEIGLVYRSYIARWVKTMFETFDSIKDRLS